MKRMSVIALLMAVVFAFTACAQSAQEPAAEAPAQEAEPATENLVTTNKDAAEGSIAVTVATPPSTSAAYAYVVGVTNCLSTYAPAYSITTIETGGAVEQANMLFKREVDFCIIMSSTVEEQVSGTGNFEGYPDDGVRLCWYYAPNIMQWLVTADSGITDIHELTGKKFGPSGQGTSNEQDTYRVFKTLGIEPDYYVASQGDAFTALQDGRIIGCSKGGYYPESYVTQVTSSIDCSMLSLSDEDVQSVCAEYPFYVPYTIPGGNYKNIDADTNSVATLMGIGTTKDTDAALIYDLVMSVYEHDDIWKSAYPTGADMDFFELACSSAVYLHAGAVKAFQDMGYTVPENLIPPEYSEIYGA